MKLREFGKYNSVGVKDIYMNVINGNIRDSVWGSVLGSIDTTVAKIMANPEDDYDTEGLEMEISTYFGLTPISENKFIRDSIHAAIHKH